MLSDRRRDGSNLNSYNSQASDELNGGVRAACKVAKVFHMRQLSMLDNTLVSQTLG